jgi:excinuclease ABC subunit B
MSSHSFSLVSQFSPTGDQPQAIDRLVESRPNNAVLLGVTGSGKTFTIANVIAQQERPVIILSPNKTLAAQLYEEFYRFFPQNKVCYFVSYYDYYQPESYLPATDVYIEKETKINQEIDRMRIEAVSASVNRRDTIIVSSVSCIYALGNPQDFKNLSVSFYLHQKTSKKEIIAALVAIEYARATTQKKMHGTFIEGIRGVDVVLSYQKEIVRIESDGESITYLGLVCRESGIEVERIDSVLIMPAKYFVTTEEKKERAIKSILSELESHLATVTNPIFRDRIESRVLRDVEFIRETGTCPGIENYTAHFERRLDGGSPFTLFDFLEDPLIIIDESHLAIPQLKGMYIGDQARKKNLVDYGFRLPSARFNRPLSFSEVEEKLKNVIYVSATPGEYELSDSKVFVEQIIRPTGIPDPEIKVYPRENQIERLREEIIQTKEKRMRTLVTVMTKRMAEDLALFFEKKEMKACYLHHTIKTQQRTEILHKLREGVFDCLIGINLLREGLDLPEVGLVAIMDADIESFLRDKRSLIQTIGRAARNHSSQVILFADKISQPMREAIEETERRRSIQIAYNKEHGITPKTAIRKVEKSILSRLFLEKQKKEKKVKEKTFEETRAVFNSLSKKKQKLFLEELKKKIITLVKAKEIKKAQEQKELLEKLSKLFYL